MLNAFLLTLIAGLSTGIGGVISIFAKRNNTKFLSFALGFSAGVMIYISMIELFFEAKDMLVSELGHKNGYLATIITFFLGMLFILIIDRMVPTKSNPHEVVNKNKMNLMNVGIITAISIAIHNFPEGMATFVSALKDSNIGLVIVVAIAIHNIPEGIAVATPIYYAANNKKKALLYSFLSGLAEPLGALLVWVLLMPYMNDLLFGIIYSMIAGVMVFISFDELLPTAEAYGNHHLSVYGVVLGMLVMAISLLMFA